MATEHEKHVANEAKDSVHWVPCERCALKSKHIVRTSIDVEEAIDEVGEVRFQSFQIVECCGSRWLSFRHALWSTNDMGDEEPLEVYEVLYPARRSGLKLLDASALPSKVREIYQQVHSALCNELTILAAIGIRALVEAVCATKGTTAKTLQMRIDELVTLGVLTTDGASILHGTRHLGNAAAHEVLPPDPAQLDAAMHVAEHLLQTVYILPGVAARLAKKTKPPDP